MPEKTYEHVTRLAKLNDELAVAAPGPFRLTAPVPPASATAPRCTLAQEGASFAWADPIVAAHDATTPSASESAQAANTQAVKDFRASADAMLAACDTYRANADTLINQTQSNTTINQTNATLRNLIQDWRSFLGDQKKFIRGVDAQFDLIAGPVSPP